MRRVCAAIAAAVGFVAASMPASAEDLHGQVKGWRLAHEREVVGLQATADRLQAELARRNFMARQLSAGPGTPPVVDLAFLAAIDALRAVHRAPSVNIKVFWEGEEERNSPHLEQILRDNHALLSADVWLIGDAPLHQSRRPTIYFGARGNTDVEATVYGPARALHSGHYGNWAPNPIAMAAQLIADYAVPPLCPNHAGAGDRLADRQS